MLITIFSSRLWYLFFYQRRWTYTGTKDQEQNLACFDSSCLPEGVCLYQLLAIKSASCDCSRKFCCKIWHQVTLYLCRSLRLDNPQPGEHPLCDYCLGCRFIKGAWCTLLHLNFTMSDGRKNK